jgi:hypothetical protein
MNGNVIHCMDIPDGMAQTLVVVVVVVVTVVTVVSYKLTYCQTV